jgi:hypothetical protein
MAIKEWDVNDMAAAFGMSQQGIGNYVREGIFIKIKKGVYDSVQSTSNFIKNKINKKETKSAVDERERLDRVRADKIEMENLQTQKELVNLKLAQQYFINLNHAVRQKLFTIPARAAPLCAGKSAAEIQLKIHNLLNEVMKELRDPDFYKMIDDAQIEKRNQKIKRKKNA